MAGEQQTTTAPTTLSREDVQRMITDTIKPLSDAQSKISTDLGTIAESLKQKPAAVAAEAEGDKGKKPEPLTAEGIAKIVQETIAKSQQTSEAKAARDAFAGDKLKDLPPIYREKLGSDPAKWAVEEQSIRDQFKADLKSQGVEPKQLGNASADGGLTADKKPVDRSKLSAMDLLNSDGKAA